MNNKFFVLLKSKIFLQNTKKNYFFRKYFSTNNKELKEFETIYKVRSYDFKKSIFYGFCYVSAAALFENPVYLIFLVASFGSVVLGRLRIEELLINNDKKILKIKTNGFFKKKEYTYNYKDIHLNISFPKYDTFILGFSKEENLINSINVIKGFENDTKSQYKEKLDLFLENCKKNN